MNITLQSCAGAVKPPCSDTKQGSSCAPNPEMQKGKKPKKCPKCGFELKE